MTLYIATCPKCSAVHETRSRNQPPGQYCNLRLSGITDIRCSGVLTWTKVPEAVDPDNPSLTDEQLARMRPLAEAMADFTVRKLTAQVKDLDRLNADLHEQIRNLNIENAKLANKSEELRAELAARQGDADHAKAYDAAMHDRDLMIEGRDDEIQKLKDEVREQTTSSDHWQSEFLRASRLMDEKRDRFDQAITNLNIDNARLQSENERLAELNNVRELEIQRLKATILTQEHECERLRRHIDRQDRLLDSATDMMVSAATVVEAATDDAGKLHEQLDKAEAELAFKTASITIANENIRKLNADIETLQKITRTS